MSKGWIVRTTSVKDVAETSVCVSDIVNLNIKIDSMNSNQNPS